MSRSSRIKGLQFLKIRNQKPKIKSMFAQDMLLSIGKQSRSLFEPVIIKVEFCTVPRLDFIEENIAFLSDHLTDIILFSV